jgi:hypothetical protein
MKTKTWLTKYKQELELDENYRLSRKFFNFVVDYFALNNVASIESVKNGLDPWFGPANDRIRKNDLTQYMESRIHQKYKVALEFAAYEAGYNEVLGYVETPEGFRPQSMRKFWFFGCHPRPVDWIFVSSEKKVVAYGREEMGAINQDTIESWLTSKVNMFRETIDVQRELEEPGEDVC